VNTGIQQMTKESTAVLGNDGAEYIDPSRQLATVAFRLFLEPLLSK
jgi:hypothetical protein